MSSEKQSLYSKPILFSVVATVVILTGTIGSVLIPMFTEDMDPSMDVVKPYTPLQLAGRDIYQREGCNNCHTQQIRPLRSEVLRYGQYSRAAEFKYDHPFLWGSKRTGPDLARIGGLYSDKWHRDHLIKPQDVEEKSNMPSYGFLQYNHIDATVAVKRAKALNFPVNDEMKAECENKTELDALVAYLQILGSFIPRNENSIQVAEDATNPFSGDSAAIQEAEGLWKQHCASCHLPDGSGNIGPSIKDAIWFNEEKPVKDSKLFNLIANGSRTGMRDFGSILSPDQIWKLVAWVRAQGK